jgi:hypothetical protein
MYLISKIGQLTIRITTETKLGLESQSAREQYLGEQMPTNECREITNANSNSK